MKIRSLSPSMVNAYLGCQRRFYYEYCLKLPRLPNHYLAFGLAFHRTVEENYFQKIRTEKDLPVNLLTEFFVQDLKTRDADWSQQSQSKTLDQGVATVRSYQKEIAPKVQPREVEYAFNMELLNRDWSIRGKADVIDQDFKVHEHKTTGRRVSVPKPEHVFQVQVYATAYQRQAQLPQIQAQIVYSLRGRDGACSFDLDFDDSSLHHILTVFDEVATGIELERWMPRRIANMYCKRRYCSFWNECEKDFPGRVAD